MHHIITIIDRHTHIYNIYLSFLLLRSPSALWRDALLLLLEQASLSCEEVSVVVTAGDSSSPKSAGTASAVSSSPVWLLVPWLPLPWVMLSFWSVALRTMEMIGWLMLLRRTVELQTPKLSGRCTPPPPRRDLRTIPSCAAALLRASFSDFKTYTVNHSNMHYIPSVYTHKYQVCG